MKKVLIFALVILLIGMTSAVYDNFNDDSFDETLWSTLNQTLSGGNVSLNETGGRLNISVIIAGASDLAWINVSSTRDYGGSLNWTLSGMQTTTYGGGGKSTFCGVNIGTTTIIGRNRSLASSVGNYTNAIWGAYTSGGNTYIMNNSLTVRTIPSSLTGKVIFWCKAQSGAAGGSGFINSSLDDVTLPINTLSITLNHPPENTTTANTSLIFNATSISPSLTELTNSTITIWYSNDSVFNKTINSLLGTTNTTTWNISFSNLNSYQWDISTCLNNGTCGQSSNRTLNWGLDKLVNVFDTQRWELQSTKINITYNTSGTTNSGTLWYSGTAYAGTLTSTGGTGKKLSAIIPLSSSKVGTNTFFWNIISDDLRANITTQTQTVTGIDFNICNSTLTNAYINMTFKNETVAEEAVNAFVSSSTWNYWIDSSTNFKTLSYSNATENNHYDFCFSQSNLSISANTTFKYDNAISEQRTWKDLLSLSNTTLDKSLYLLPSADGIFVTFQVVDAADQIIKNVNVNATKSSTLIESGVTNDAGIVTFFLDPDTTYTFIFAKSGSTSVTTTFAPTQTSYTITMGSSTSTTINDFTKGISYSITPINKTLLNNTQYTFTFTIGSSYWTIDSFGFGLRNGSHSTTLNYTSVSTNGGTASVILNTENHTSIIIDAFWIINGNVTNITDPWFVWDASGTDYSVQNFFDRLINYTSTGDGMFGLKMNTLSFSLIVYFIIFLIVGVMTLKYGLTNSTGILFIAFTVVYIFDVVLGLIPKMTGVAFPIATTLMGLALIGSLIKEVTR